MDTLYKLEVLKDTYSNEAELDLILGVYRKIQHLLPQR